jgi:hypothetical protein
VAATEDKGAIRQGVDDPVASSAGTASQEGNHSDASHLLARHQAPRWILLSVVTPEVIDPRKIVVKQIPWQQLRPDHDQGSR